MGSIAAMEFSPQLSEVLKRANRKQRIKEIATGLGVIISIWIASRISSWFNLSLKDQFDLLVVVVVMNAIATISLSRTAARRPENIRRELFDALLNSEPITPRHVPPTAVAEGWGSLVTDKDRQFFEDFRDFAEVINSWLADKHVGSSWRLQELPDTELRLAGSDMPYFGRRYSIFHSQVGVGTLEVEPGFEYSTENRIGFFIRRTVLPSSKDQVHSMMGRS
jgi:hypothetical protein